MTEEDYFQMEENAASDQQVPMGVKNALDNYLYYGYHPGAALEALLSDKLFAFVRHADEETVDSLRFIAHYLREFPAGAVGSEGRFQRWLEHRGLAGREPEAN